MFIVYGLLAMIAVAVIMSSVTIVSLLPFWIVALVVKLVRTKSIKDAWGSVNFFEVIKEAIDETIESC